MSTPIEPPPTSGGRAEFEFNQWQEHLFNELARDMRWVALPLMILGVVYAVATGAILIYALTNPAALLQMIFSLLTVCFLLALGTWTRKAADAFIRITTTSGEDVTHLMEGVNYLRKTFSLLSVLVKVYLVLAMMGLLFTLVLLFAGAVKG